MKRIHLFLFLFFTALFLLQSVTISAQKDRKTNKLERASDRKEVSTDKKQLQRDRNELAAFNALTTAFKEAFQARNANKIAKLKGEILLAMDREVQQANAKIDLADQEKNKSRVEAANSAKEAHQDRTARDKANRVDDKKDLKDDKHDVSDRVHRRNNQAKLYEAMKIATFAFDGRELKKAEANREILTAFIKSMENDLEATEKELQEDKGELKEDRQETREDRGGK